MGIDTIGVGGEDAGITSNVILIIRIKCIRRRNLKIRPGLAKWTLWAHGLCSASFILDSIVGCSPLCPSLPRKETERKFEGKAFLIGKMALQLLKLPVNLVSLCLNSNPSLSFLSHCSSRKISGTLSTLLSLCIRLFYSVVLVVAWIFLILTHRLSQWDGSKPKFEIPWEATRL